jgi:two-component system chemotaxis response regulator CheY
MKHILVVDDSPTIRKAIRRILEQLGHVVEEAGDGEEAIARLQGHRRYDGVLCDIDMPNMDGLAFLGALPKFPAITPPPIIMCTTHTSFDKIALALTLGASEYIMKPFDSEIIASKLDACGVT